MLACVIICEVGVGGAGGGIPAGIPWVAQSPKAMVFTFVLLMVGMVHMSAMHESLRELERKTDSALALAREREREAAARLQASRADLPVISIFDDPANSFFRYPGDAYEARGCPAALSEIKCTLTRTDPQHASARFFHIPNLQQAGTFGLPQRRFEAQVYLGFASETPLYYSWLSNATFMGQFDHTFGYPKSRPPGHTNVALGPYSWNGMLRNPALRVPGYAAEMDFTRELLDDIKRSRSRPESLSGRRGAFWMAANCGARNGRHELVRQLIRNGYPGGEAGLAVDSYGSCLHTKDAPHGVGGGDTHAEHDLAKLVLMRAHAFDLAFENSHCDEYVTEKVWHGLASGVIPVFFGTDSAHSLLPDPKAAIFASDFASPWDLSLYLSALDQDPALREVHLAWRAKFEAYANSGAKNSGLSPDFIELLERSKRVNQEENLLCLMCAEVLRRKRGEGAGARAGPYPPCEEANARALQFVRRSASYAV